MQATNDLIPDFDNKCARLMFNTPFSFTKRESEILVLFCYDFAIDNIASILHRSPKTIFNHRENARKKTPFKTNMGLAAELSAAMHK